MTQRSASALSVSSDGSNGVKRPSAMPWQRLSSSFSILRRIEWGETVRGVGSRMGILIFQYPQTDRMG